MRQDPAPEEGLHPSDHERGQRRRIGRVLELDEESLPVGLECPPQRQRADTPPGSRRRGDGRTGSRLVMRDLLPRIMVVAEEGPAGFLPVRFR
jgi:hypothetical protein